MKILFCTNKFDEVTNGPAKFANLILEINQLYPAHEIRILTEDVKVSTKKIYKLELKVPKSLNLFSQFFRIRQYHHAAKNIFKSFPFDVIIYNNAFIGLQSAKFFPYSIGMINDFNNASRNLKNFQFNHNSLKQLIFKRLEYKSTQYFTKIIVNSDFLKKYLCLSYPHITNKTYRLYKAIEEPKNISEKVLNPDLIQVLFVKADYMTGGLDILIQSLQSISKVNFKLTVIGPDRKFWDHIKSFCNKTNTQLDILGPQEQAKVFKALLNTDIFCVPSRREALGVANLEALARGVPVVSTHVGGIPEVLNHGQNGWLVPTDNVLPLAQQIQECLNNETERKKKVAYGISFSQQFLKEQMFDHFIEIVQSRD